MLFADENPTYIKDMQRHYENGWQCGWISGLWVGAFLAFMAAAWLYDYPDMYMRLQNCIGG